MKLHTVAAITLVALVAMAGVALAAPGNAPADPGADDSAHGNSDDAREDDPTENEAANDVSRSENASAAEDRGVERSENESAADGNVSAANAQGPGEDLPEQIPDHVSQIHDLIRQHLGSTFDGSLGDLISGVAASDDAASGTTATGSG
jgi:hypothetical protein